MVKDKKVFFVLIFFLVVSLSFSVYEWEFNGTVYDVNGTALYNATINVSIYNKNFQIVAYNSTYSNGTGWFNISVTDNSTWFYKPVITHFENNATDGSTPIDFVGQNLPAFPLME